jgi:hypothetical protein
VALDFGTELSYYIIMLDNILTVNIYGISWDDKDEWIPGPVSIQGFRIDCDGDESKEKLFEVAKRDLEEHYDMKVLDICEVIIKKRGIKVNQPKRAYGF